MTPIYLVDEWAAIVGKVELNLLSHLQSIDPMIQGIHYLHGHPMEIVQILSQRDQDGEFQFKKYPLIALFQDFPETHNGDIGVYAQSRFHLIIANGTNPNYRASERYTENFKPILYPIYFELLNQINTAKVFMTYGVQSLSHTKIDRLFWGKEGLYGNDGNIFNDWIDCIEIRDLELKINLKLC